MSTKQLNTWEENRCMEQDRFYYEAHSGDEAETNEGHMPASGDKEKRGPADNETEQGFGDERAHQSGDEAMTEESDTEHGNSQGFGEEEKQHHAKA